MRRRSAQPIVYIASLMAAVAVGLAAGVWLSLAWLAVPNVTRVGSIMWFALPSELVFHAPGGGEAYCRDADSIREVASVLLPKRAALVGRTEWSGLKAAATFDYGYKGNTVSVLQDGTALIYQDKAEIRERSRLHWV